MKRFLCVFVLVVFLTSCSRQTAGQVETQQAETRQVETGQAQTSQAETGQVQTRQVETKQAETAQVETVQTGKETTAAAAGSQVYYVATDGNDSNPGTDASPFQTVARGVSQLKPGDTLYIKSGTYIQSEPLTISQSGTASAPITISTAPGQPSQAIITGDTNGDGVAEVPEPFSWHKLVDILGDYIVFQNLEVSYSGGRGVSPEGNHVTVRGCNIHHIWRDGIYVYGQYAVIEKNTVWRSAEMNYCNLAPGRKCNDNWEGAIAIGDPNAADPPGVATKGIIRGNSVYQNSGEGILCMHTGGVTAGDGVLIENNQVYDNWAAGVDLDKCSNSTVQNNLIYYSDDTKWWKEPELPGSGILISNEQTSVDKTTRRGPGDPYPIGHDRLIANNIVVGAGANFSFWLGDGPTDTGANFIASALKNDLIANNTFVEAQGKRGSGIKIEATYPGYSHENTRFVNNLILQTSGNPADVGNNGIKGITFANNLWSRTPPRITSPSTDISGNPGLVDPKHLRGQGEVRAEWYMLLPGSPAIGKGQVLSQVPTDYFGVQRKSPPDIGAVEFGK